MVTILKGLALLVCGLLFGFVIDVVAYNFVDDIACVPTDPDACFLTRRGAIRSIVYGLLLCIPVTTAITFVAFIGPDRVQRASHRVLLFLVGAILVLWLINTVTRQVG